MQDIYKEYACAIDAFQLHRGPEHIGRLLNNQTKKWKMQNCGELAARDAKKQMWCLQSLRIISLPSHICLRHFSRRPQKKLLSRSARMLLRLPAMLISRALSKAGTTVVSRGSTSNSPTPAVVRAFLHPLMPLCIITFRKTALPLRLQKARTTAGIHPYLCFLTRTRMLMLRISTLTATR